MLLMSLFRAGWQEMVSTQSPLERLEAIICYTEPGTL